MFVNSASRIATPISHIVTPISPKIATPVSHIVIPPGTLRFYFISVNREGAFLYVDMWIKLHNE